MNKNRNRSFKKKTVSKLTNTLSTKRFTQLMCVIDKLATGK